jgi:hypothetical protein
VSVFGRIVPGCILWLMIGSPASACVVPPNPDMVAKYDAAAKARATLIVVGSLKPYRRGRREFGMLTAEKVLKGARKKTYVVTYQILLCTYRIPSVKRAIFYLEAAPGGFQLLATSAVK